VTNLNDAEEKYAAAQAKNDLSAQIALQPALNFNGGGHINHSIFWNNLTAPGSASLESALGWCLGEGGETVVMCL
jgi:superoxide dismutase, Fe-Mn family